MQSFEQSLATWVRVFTHLEALNVLVTLGLAAKKPGAKDPLDMCRYTGSEIVGYRAPKFDEFVLPLGPPANFSPLAYEKSIRAEGRGMALHIRGSACPDARRGVSELQV